MTNHACGGYLAMATASRVAEAPPQPGSASPPTSLSILSKTNSEMESMGYRLIDVRPVELPDPPEPRSDLPVSSLPPPPPPPPPVPAPAREKEVKAPYGKTWRSFQINPKVHLAMSQRYAEGALEHYNKRKKIKFELLDVKPVVSVPEPHCCYTHINFTARSSKEGSKEQLFFAELYHYFRMSVPKDRRPASSGSGKRRSPCCFSVTCCEPLGPDSTAGHKFAKPDAEDTSVVRKHNDFAYCFACTERMLHPKGERYIAGHCTVPHIYSSIR